MNNSTENSCPAPATSVSIHRIFRSPSLFLRVATVCTLISLLSVGVGVLLFLWQVEKTELVRLNGEGTRLREVLQSLTSQKAGDDAAILERCQELSRSGTGVNYIVVEPNRGESLIVRGEEWTMNEMPNELKLLGLGDGVNTQSPWTREPVLHFSFTSEIAGQVWGNVSFGLTKSRHEEAKAAALRNCAFGAALCSLVSVAGAFVMARRISRPVAVLRDMARRLAEGDLGARAQIQTTGEIAELGESMNQMATELDESHRLLRVRAEREHELASINAEFLACEPNDLDKTFRTSLQAIANHLAAQAISVFLYSEDRESFRREWGWHAADAGFAGFESYPADSFAWGLKQLACRAVIKVDPSIDLPPEATAERFFMERHRIASLAVARLGTEEKPAGMLILWTRDFDQKWDDSHLQFIATVAGTLSNAIARRHVAREREFFHAQLLQSQKMEAVGKLSGGIAHDFNNMLVPIVGYSDSLINSLPPDAPWLPEIREIKRAAESAAALTRQLLTFSRKQIISRSELDLNQLVLTLKKMLRRLIGENVDLVTRLAPDAWTVSADAGQVEQCMVNLCVNARHAIPDSGTITIRSEMIDSEAANFTPPASGKLHGLFLRLSVQDTGCGMDAATLGRVFEPFYSTKGADGTGLGLSVVHGVMEQHGGWISVQSKPGQGTVFQLYFPALREAAVAIPDTKPVKVSPKPLSKGNGESILLVEDEAGVLAFVSAALKQNGYKVIAADCGAAARRLFAEHRDVLDLVMSDVVLPDASGVDLVQEFLSDRPDLRILLSSGYSEKNSLVELVQKRGLSFLHKPYTLTQLLDRIREALTGTSERVIA